LICEICTKLGIETKNIKSSELNIPPKYKKIEGILEICKKLNAKTYITGPKAKNYIQNDLLFRELNIDLKFHEYHYPKYPQLYNDFEPNLSIIDLLFNTGESSPEYIWGNKCKNIEPETCVKS
jgi:hypothetical protein